MAHYAKLGINSEVMSIIVVNEQDTHNADGVEDELVGIQFLERNYGWPLWKKCSYNTTKGTHTLGGTAFRANFPNVGWIYNSTHDIFHPTKLHDSHTLNATTGMWDAPITYPSVTTYEQDSATHRWVIIWNETKYQADNTKGWTAFKLGEMISNKAYDWNGSSWIADF